MAERRKPFICWEAVEVIDFVDSSSEFQSTYSPQDSPHSLTSDSPLDLLDLHYELDPSLQPRQILLWIYPVPDLTHPIRLKSFEIGLLSSTMNETTTISGGTQLDLQ